MEHGLRAYRRDRCRCLVCRAANTAACALTRARRLARLQASPSPESDPGHGTVNGYNAGCRCEACAFTRHLRYVKEERPRLHRWREQVTEVYRLARFEWERLREAATLGYLHRPPRSARPGRPPPLTDEHRDFLLEHPAPTLGGIMRALAGQQDGSGSLYSLT